MPLMVDCKCKNCKQPFQARAADRARGWGQFCSKRCKAQKQERRTGQHADYLHRQRISTANLGQTAGDLQREYGGIPQFDRHGRYEGLTGIDPEINLHHGDHERD